MVYCTDEIILKLWFTIHSYCIVLDSLTSIACLYCTSLQDDHLPDLLLYGDRYHHTIEVHQRFSVDTHLLACSCYLSSTNSSTGTEVSSTDYSLLNIYVYIYTCTPIPFCGAVAWNMSNSSQHDIIKHLNHLHLHHCHVNRWCIITVDSVSTGLVYTLHHIA